MKKKLICRFILCLSPLLFLVSCSPKGYVKNITVKSIYAGGGKIRVIGADFLSPFDTSISANLYYQSGQYTDKELSDIEETINDNYLLAHALSDRHYSYYLEGNDEPLTNLKTINDSYASESSLILDPYLYNLLKQSYEFSLASDGKFNIFLGTLNDIYEAKLDEIQKDKNRSSLDAVFEFSSNRYFASFTEEERNYIEKVKEAIPHSRNEMQGILTFDDEKKTVVFHSYKDTKALKISLGGCAKGYATEWVSDKVQAKYPKVSLLLNSGFSSIKAVGTRPDSKPWKIRYDNPVYYEQIMPSKTNYAKNELSLTIDGPFNLSTSGYYNQYFYEFEEGNPLFQRRSHILDGRTGYSASFFDQVSLLSDNAFYADMMTTAIMNTSSIAEANSLVGYLEGYFSGETDGLLLSYKTKKGAQDHYSYSLNDYRNLSAKSGLPIATLTDGTKYEGDYQGHPIDSVDNVDSTFSPEFEETYLLSDNLYDKASLLSDRDCGTKNPKRIAVLRKAS